MFEGAVAGILNRLLGKYVQDLDTENLNVGIFSGNVNLTDLKLKPEALVRNIRVYKLTSDPPRLHTGAMLILVSSGKCTY
jgi:hypothetical protein